MLILLEKGKSINPNAVVSTAIINKNSKTQMQLLINLTSGFQHKVWLSNEEYAVLMQVLGAVHYKDARVT